MLALPYAAGQAVKDYGPALFARWTAPKRRFVIVTNGRTGSELLVSLLDSHPDIVCDGELFKPPRRLPNVYVSARSASSGARGAKAFGWKLLHGQYCNDFRFGDAESYLRRLNSHGYQLIFLERRDPVQQVVSWTRASQTRYHQRNGEACAVEPISIEPMQVLVHAYMIDAVNRFYRDIASQLDHLWLVYEEDLADASCHQATVDKVCSYLGLPLAPCTTDLLKSGPRHVREAFSNFDEVAQTLRGTPYERYLIGDPNQG